MRCTHLSPSPPPSLFAHPLSSTQLSQTSDRDGRDEVVDERLRCDASERQHAGPSFLPSSLSLHPDRRLLIRMLQEFFVRFHGPTDSRSLSFLYASEDVVGAVL